MGNSETLTEVKVERRKKSGTVETFKAKARYDVELPGKESGGGVEYKTVDTLTSIEFTPGEVDRSGQPIDFSGTEEEILSESKTIGIDVTILDDTDGDGLTESTGFCEVADNDGKKIAADILKEYFKMGKLPVGPDLSVDNFDLIEGEPFSFDGDASSLLDLERGCGSGDGSGAGAGSLRGNNLRLDAVGTLIGIQPTQRGVALEVVMDGTVDAFFNGLAGDANDDGNVNLADAQKILGYLFLGSSAPICLGSADVNGDKMVNIADATALLNFLFLGGPAPRPFQGCFL